MAQTSSESASATSSAPVLSTPDSYNFDSCTLADSPLRSKLSDDALRFTYEVSRTIEQIKKHEWQRIALQFPDSMLPDAPRVYEILRDGLKSHTRRFTESSWDIEGRKRPVRELEDTVVYNNNSERSKSHQSVTERKVEIKEEMEKLFILGDTSYGACCVDEIAAEHVSADAVVHYGRACLSPTIALPTLHIFTIQPIDVATVMSCIEATYTDKNTRILLVSDVTYSSHVSTLASSLEECGYENVFATEIVHDPSSLIPNRTVPPNLIEATENMMPLADWHLFHISEPPSALLLTLAARVASIRIFHTKATSMSSECDSKVSLASLASPMPLLRRRYGILTRLRTATIIGILINTLSASTTLPVLKRLSNLISLAGKKSYSVVVGKVNEAKLANFAEIDAWVVVGCWESSLLEDSEGKGGSGWWKPCVTPWELEAALCRDSNGASGWTSDLESLIANGSAIANHDTEGDTSGNNTVACETSNSNAGPLAGEEESEPPEFDLITGKYVSVSRPTRKVGANTAEENKKGVQALTRKSKAHVASIKGEESPGATFLRDRRTWQGLGSDFEIAYDPEQGVPMEEGRSGLARGYNAEKGEKILEERLKADL